MAQTFRKYYPVAVKKSPYVILEPDEYTAMMNEEYVKYTDADFTKIKSFSRMAKYIIAAWLLLAVFVVIHQTFYGDTIVFEGKTQRFLHSIRYVFTSEDAVEPRVEFRSDANELIFQGIEKCIVGVTYKPDKCNSCACEDGRLGCTKMFCQDNSSSFVLL